MSKGNNLQSLFCGILFCISITALVIACLAFTKKGGGKEGYLAHPDEMPFKCHEWQAACAPTSKVYRQICCCPESDVLPVMDHAHRVRVRRPLVLAHWWLSYEKKSRTAAQIGGTLFEVGIISDLFGRN